MKKMSVRDIRQNWPEAERALREEGEIIVTRDSKPVARIVPIAGAVLRTRARLDPGALARWRTRFWKDQPEQPSTDRTLADDREDR